jgi:carotenoid cleavage dioxygenase-like enzyme
VGGVPGGGERRTTRRRFLVGAGTSAGLLAVGCSSSDDPDRRTATGTAATAAAATSDTGASKYVSGPFAPVADERTLVDLEVRGRLPAELEGLYLRNGPNPWPVPDGRYHWFTGDGMVHGVALGDGRARWYRNRWVRTAARAERLGQPDPGGPPEPFPAPNAGNTSVIRHAGHLLALYEVGLPHELSGELDTLGRFDFAGCLAGPMTAHPKLDPATGELHLFGYLPGLRYAVADASGAIVRTEDIPLPAITMMHDFSLTENHVVFYDLPVVFEPALVERTALPFAWKPDAGARLGVLPRAGTAADLVWVEVEPAFVYHTLNAHDRPDGRGVVLDVVRHDSAFADIDSFAGTHPPSLHRWTVDLPTRRVTDEPLEDRPLELPRVDPRRTGRASRYGYAVALDPAGDDDNDFAPTLLQVDLERGRTTEHDVGAGRVPGEATFVPASEAAAEDEGWVLSLVLDQATDTTELLVLDTTDFAGPPVATVAIPARVPVGFHGAWFPAG